MVGRRDRPFGGRGADSYVVEVRFESEFSGCKQFIFVDVDLKRVLCPDRDRLHQQDEGGEQMPTISTPPSG